jgi:CRP/FNR family transcriptional regulator
VNSTSDVELVEAEFFRALPAERLTEMRRGLCERRFEARQALFFEGEPADHLWLVRRGEVRLYKSSAGGRTTTLESLGPGQVFGALSALAEERYPASAEAVTDCAAWCLPRDPSAPARAAPDAAREILRIVAQRLREAHEQVRPSLTTLCRLQRPGCAGRRGVVMRRSRRGA